LKEQEVSPDPNANTPDAAAARAARARAESERVQKQLDEALEASFPASDPVSIVTSQQEEDWKPEKP
jgi:hypothetical protein